MIRRPIALAVVLSLAVLGAAAAAAGDIPLQNWSAPPTWSAASTGRSTLADTGAPAILVPFSPCRIADTRGVPPFAGAYGAPSLVGGAPGRSFPIPSNPTCTGIAPGAVAFSLNFTVVAPVSTPPGGFLKAYPTGAAAPVVSTLNFGPGSILANAAVVPAGTSGGISVAVNFTTDLIIDINGYYIGGTGSLNAGERLLITGSYGGGGMVKGTNNFNGAVSYGGFFETFATTDGAIGSYGLAWGPTGLLYGVRGETRSTTNGTVGVWGNATGATGRTYGVLGEAASISSGAAGVQGRVGTTAFTDSTFVSGVLGLADGGTFPVGVVGLGVYRGVTGWRVNSAGALQTYGILGSQGVDGVYAGGNLAATGTKTFVEPHPTEAGKVIKYAALEGPESGTYFRGRSRFEGKVAVLPVPEDFRLVSDEEGLTVHVTPIGAQASVWVSRMDLNWIIVQSTRDVEFSYIVHGVRKAYRDFTPVERDVHYFIPLSPADRLQEKGLVPALQARLVATGVYNEDGTVNMGTAERMGWAQRWRDEEKARAEAAARTAAAPPAPSGVDGSRP